MTKLPFEEEVEENSKSGVKLDNSKSRFAKKDGSVHSEKEFNEAIGQHNDRLSKTREKIATLSTSFMNFVKDTTLPENKSPIQVDLEKSTARELIDLAMQLNSDEQQPEGIGSCGMLMLLMRVVLTQRDTINKLSYELKEFKNQHKEQHKKIIEIIKDLDQRTIGSLRC